MSVNAAAVLGAGASAPGRGSRWDPGLAGVIVAGPRNQVTTLTERLPLPA
ncbi:hypothetical protein GCM10027445_52120 [Amycolatopsis endophytica]|uniref:Uncharacterized protein n=1 Tax=Amycolatopsis endophytica TaxID=860233 RepID=A0A853BAB5_9PSEU|nr:hypothetical protein [Amycolatopsis endophytica]